MIGYSSPLTHRPAETQGQADHQMNQRGTAAFLPDQSMSPPSFADSDDSPPA